MSLRRPPQRPGGQRGTAAPDGLAVVYCRIDRTLKAELHRLARVAGKTDSDFVRELLTSAANHRPGRGTDDGVLRAQLEELAFRLDDVGVSTRAAVRLLAHWAAQSGAVRVTEDELLAELRAVGRDEWQQAVEEGARSEPSDTTGATSGVGRVLE
jgi:hypothetical protein